MLVKEIKEDLNKWRETLCHGLPWWLCGKESACQCRRHRFDTWVRKTLWGRKWQPTAAFLPGEFHGQRNLAGYSPQGCKESDTTEPHTHTHTHTMSWIGRLNIAKIKNHSSSLVYIDKLILKVIWKDKGNGVAKIILKEIKLEEITLLDFNPL